MDPQLLYSRLEALIQSTPSDLGLGGPLSSETKLWLGRANALIEALADFGTRLQFGVALGLLDHHPVRSTENIVAVLYNALAIAELRLPSVSKGAFIPVGNTFDVLSALSKTFLAAERDVLIIDPYMDNRVLTDFAPLAAEGVNIRLLTDQKSCAPTFAPAVQRWKSQYAKKRPLSARLAPARTLHDRLIIVDATEVWILTQSLKDFAARSPASIVRSDTATAALKIAAYQDIWNAASSVE